MKRFGRGKCNSDKCHCPDCVREKRQDSRIDSLDARVGRLEIRERMRLGREKADAQRHIPLGTDVRTISLQERTACRHPDQRATVNGAEVVREFRNGKRVYRGLDNNPAPLWSWRVWRVADGLVWFRKFNEIAQQFFGAPWRYKSERVSIICNPSSNSDNWVQNRFLESELRSGAFHDWKPMPGYTAEGAIIGRDIYAEFAKSVPRWAGVGAYTGRWETGMTPFMLKVMLHAYSNCDAFPNRNSGAYAEAVRRLTAQGLIEGTTADEQRADARWTIKATEKGRVFVTEGLLKTKVPVQREPEWRMP